MRKLALYFGPETNYKCKRSDASNRALPLAVLIALGLSAVPALGSDKEGLLLKQTSRLAGAYDLLVCKQGVKLTMKSRQLVILFTPPAWNVQFISLNRKVYCQEPASKWTSPTIRIASYFRPGDPSSLKSTGSEPSTLDGISCRKHTLKLPPGVNSDGKHAWEKLLIRDGYLYCIVDPFYPKAVTAALARTIGSVPVDGIPLELRCVSNRGKKEAEVTLDGHSQVAIKASDFEIPKDYKQVATPNEVTSSAAENEGFAELIH